MQIPTDIDFERRLAAHLGLPLQDIQATTLDVNPEASGNWMVQMVWTGRRTVPGEDYRAALTAAVNGVEVEQVKQELRPIVEGTQGAVDIVRERVRQITEEGYTPEHDRQHSISDFEATVVRYLHGTYPSVVNEFPIKRKGLRRDLVRAGALIAAAIDLYDANDQKSETDRAE